MGKLPKKIILLARLTAFLMSYSIGFELFGQPEFYRHFGITEGLPSSTVYHVMQDSKGYLWFCTGRGVSRYNGYEFTNFTTSEGLADNTIFESIEDYKHRIWFRSFSGKLSYYYKDSIYQIANQTELTKALNGALTTLLYVDSTDHVFLTGHPLNGVITFSIAHPTQLKILPVKDKYIGIRDRHNQKLVNLISIHGYLLGIPDTNSVSIQFLSNTEPTLKDQLKSVFRHQLNIPSTTTSRAISLKKNLFAIGLHKSFLIVDSSNIYHEETLNGTITDLKFDNKNQLWVTALQQAPVIYENGKFVSDPLLDYLSDKEISSVAFDKEGGVWFSSLKSGVYYLSSLTFKPCGQHLNKGEDKISIIASGKNGVIYASRGDNTIYVLRKDSCLHAIDLPPVSFPPWKNQTEIISGFSFYPDRTLRVTTNNGLSVFQTEQSYKRTDLIKSPTAVIAQFIKEPFSPNWIASSRFLHRLEGPIGALKFSKKFDFTPRCFSILPFNENECWLGTINGLYKFKNDSITYLGDKNPLFKNRIGSMYLSPEGSIWISTQNTGLIIVLEDTIVHLTASTGLLSNFCRGLLFDKQGNCWVGSNKGLTRINYFVESKRQIRIKSIENFNGPGITEVRQLIRSDNWIYFTTNNGLIRFREDDLNQTRKDIPLYLKELQVNHKTVLPVSNALQLKYWQNYLVFNFEALSYKNTFPLAYRYRLIGIDTGWVYTTARNAHYPELSPGNYVFEVQVQHSDGQWSNSTPSLYIKISPPVWETWWAKTLVLLGIAIFIYWRVGLVLRRERKKSEIANQLNAMELKTLRSQLNPHFLFNSLSTLSSLIDINPEQANQFVEELSTVYRYTLKYRDREMVELSAELEYVRAYIYLMQIRFDENLKIDWAILEKHLTYLLPAHSLQLLIENCFKHNSMNSKNPLLIRIESNDKDYLTVTNSIFRKEHSNESTGLGLASLQKRYQILTQKDITILKTETNFQVSLPLFTADQLKENKLLL